MFRYNSVQTHSDLKHGKECTTIKRVVIHGTSGYKLVSIRTAGKTKKSKKRLTRKEVQCIRKCQFVPGLFKDCHDCISNL